MAAAICTPQLDEFTWAMTCDPLALASDLACALQILEQCQARDVTPGDELLEHVDWLMGQVEMLQVFGRIKMA